MKYPKVAADFMNRQVDAIRADSPVLDAVRVLLRRGYSGAPIVDQQGKLVGMLSEHDCVKALLTVLRDEMPAGNVENYMTREVAQVSPDDNVIDVATRFATGGNRRFPVVDKAGKLVGLISRRDLMRALDSALDQSERMSTYDILQQRRG